MKEKITIYDIAKKLEISAATVSRALNNNPKISEKTRKLVLETAEKMNYEQNKLAQALKSGKTNTVGIIVSHIDRSFFATVIRGIEEELSPNGYHIIICQSYDTEEKELQSINTLLNAQVDGILISTSNVSKDFEKEVRKITNKGIPLIFFDRKRDIQGVSAVTLDDFRAGYIATKHLIDNGCKRIAHLAGDRSIAIYQDRFEGYKQALEDHDIDFNEDYVVKAKSKIDAGREAAVKLMKLSPAPDALFSSSDYVALGAMNVLQEMGVKIPEEFKIAGFSNAQFTRLMELTMTTIDQSPLEMGKIAARVFLEQVENEGMAHIEKKVVLPPKLLTRKSSM